jgi:hypothetical protein
MDIGTVPYTLTARALSQSGSYDLNDGDWPVYVNTYDIPEPAGPVIFAVVVRWQPGTGVGAAPDEAAPQTRACVFVGHGQSLNGRFDVPKQSSRPPVTLRDAAQLTVAGFRPRLMEDDPAAELGTSVRLPLRVAAPEWRMAPRDGGLPADRMPTSAMAGRA